MSSKLKEKDPETINRFQRWNMGHIIYPHVNILIAVPLSKSMEISYLIPLIRDTRISMYNELLDRYGGNEQLFARDIWINVFFSLFCALITFISLKLCKKY